MADSRPPFSPVLLLVKLALLLCVAVVLWLGGSTLYRAAIKLLGLAPPPPQSVQLHLVGSSPDAAWQLRPLQGDVQVKPGQFVQLMYELRNNSPYFASVQALPQYSPAAAASHVQKLDCFCFAEQRFAPGQTRRFPVVLVLDKALPATLHRITLSYVLQGRPA